MMSEIHEKSYWCQEIPLEVTGVRLTFEDWKFIVDWSGSGEVAPDARRRMRCPSKPRSKILWSKVFPRTFFQLTNLANKFDEHWIAALYSLEECCLLLKSRFKNVVTKSAFGSSHSYYYLTSADINGQHLHHGQR